MESVRKKLETADGLTITTEGQNLLKVAVDEMGFTATQYENAVRVGKTIATMDGRDKVDSPHIAEALQYQFRAENF